MSARLMYVCCQTLSSGSWIGVTTSTSIRSILFWGAQRQQRIVQEPLVEQGSMYQGVHLSASASAMM